MPGFSNQAVNESTVILSLSPLKSFLQPLFFNQTRKPRFLTKRSIQRSKIMKRVWKSDNDRKCRLKEETISPEKKGRTAIRETLITE